MYLRPPGPERDALDRRLAALCHQPSSPKFEPKWKREAAARKANTKARKNGGAKKRR